MQVSESDLQEFIQLYQKEFGEVLTPEEAEPIAEKLVVFYERILNHPLPESDREEETT